MSLKLLRGPRMWAESQEQWATLGAYKPFSPLAWIKVLKRSPGSCGQARQAHTRGRQRPGGPESCDARLWVWAGHCVRRSSLDNKKTFLPTITLREWDCLHDGGLEERVEVRGEHPHLAGTVQW